MVVAEILGVVNEVTPVPPANTDPPDVAAYQSIVSPALTVAEILTVPVPHREPAVPVGAVGTEIMVTSAVSVAVQPATLVAVKVYTVDALADTPDGFWKPEVNPEGFEVQLYLI